MSESWTIIASRHKGGREPYLTWTGGARDRNDAHARTSRALSLASAAIDVPTPGAHLTTHCHGGEPEETIWSIGTRLRAAPRARRKPIAGIPYEPSGWLEALTHEAFGYGVEWPCYGIRLDRRPIESGRPLRCEFRQWTLTGPMKTDLLHDYDAIERVMALLAASAFSDQREGKKDEWRHQVDAQGDLYSATLRAARAKKLREEHASALAEAKAWFAGIEERGTP